MSLYILLLQVMPELYAPKESNASKNVNSCIFVTRKPKRIILEKERGEQRSEIVQAENYERSALATHEAGAMIELSQKVLLNDENKARTKILKQKASDSRVIFKTGSQNKKKIKRAQDTEEIKTLQAGDLEKTSEVIKHVELVEQKEKHPKLKCNTKSRDHDLTPLVNSLIAKNLLEYNNNWLYVTLPNSDSEIQTLCSDCDIKKLLSLNKTYGAKVFSSFAGLSSCVAILTYMQQTCGALSCETLILDPDNKELLAAAYFIYHGLNKSSCIEWFKAYLSADGLDGCTLNKIITIPLKHKAFWSAIVDLGIKIYTREHNNCSSLSCLSFYSTLSRRSYFELYHIVTKYRDSNIISDKNIEDYASFLHRLFHIGCNFKIALKLVSDGSSSLQSCIATNKAAFFFTIKILEHLIWGNDPWMREVRVSAMKILLPDQLGIVALLSFFLACGMISQHFIQGGLAIQTTSTEAFCNEFRKKGDSPWFLILNAIKTVLSCYNPNIDSNYENSDVQTNFGARAAGFYKWLLSEHFNKAKITTIAHGAASKFSLRSRINAMQHSRKHK